MAATPLAPVVRHIHKLLDPSMALADARLLEQFVQHRDEDAFAELVRRHGPLVWRVCRQVLGHVQHAEEAYQATFLVLARRAAKVRKSAALASFLYGVAYRIARNARTDLLRKQSRPREPIAAPPADPAHEAAWRELGRIVIEEVHALPEKYRAPILLCYWEGLTNEEAALRLDWPAGTVKTRLLQARRLLHERLTRRGVSLPAGVLATLLASGGADAAVPPPLATTATQPALALAEGAIGGMAPAKLKIILALLVATGTLAGVSTLAHPGWVVRQPETKQSGQPKEETKATVPRQSPKEKPQVRTDRYGDPLPPGATARLGTVRLRPGNRLLHLAWLPDRKTVLSVATEETMLLISVWRMTTGELLRRFELSGRGLGGGTLSSDGKTLVLCGYDLQRKEHRFLFWDVPSGKVTRESAWVGGPLEVRALALDGKTIATVEDDRILRLRDIKTRAEIRRFAGVKDLEGLMTFSPDGKILASTSKGRLAIQLWDTATGRELRTLAGDSEPMSRIVFSPDGKTLATVGDRDKTVRLWNVANGKEVRKLHSETATSVLAFSPDGKVLAAGGERVEGKILTPSPICLWDVSTGRALRRLPGHLFGVNALSFSADGKQLVSGSAGGVLRLWDVGTGKDLLPFAEHESYVNSVAFSPDGQSLATGGLDGTIRLWEPASSKPARVFEGGHQQRVWQVAFASNGQTLISSGYDGWVRFRDTATGRQTRQLQVTKDRTNSVFASSPDGCTLAVWGKDAPIRLLDATTGEERRRLTDVARYPGILRFSPDGRKLVSMSAAQPGGTNSLQLWDTATGQETRRWTLTQPGPVVFSPDGRTLAGVGADFLPAGLEQRTIHQWDAASGEDRPFVVHQPARVFSLAYSPDGRMLVWGDTAGTITLWDLATAQVRRRLKGHHSYVESLAFSRDGKSLASGSADTTALVWDVTGRPITARPSPLAAERLRTLWADLASQDAAQAFDAIGMLTAAPEQAIPMLKDKLHPAPTPADRQQVTRLIAELDSDQFTVRQKATEQLRKLSERAEPALLEALNGKRTLEARKRIEELLETIRNVSATPQRLRELRAVEVFEYIGTSEAQKVLQSLAKGAAEARLTREAKASLERLARRSSAKP